jgi:hypothetical protein
MLPIVSCLDLRIAQCQPQAGILLIKSAAQYEREAISVDVLKQSSNLPRGSFATARCRNIALVQSRCDGLQ